MMTYIEAYGKHVPSFGGRCLLADVGGLNMMPLSFALIVGPCGLFYGFVAPYIGSRPGGWFAVLLVVSSMLASLYWLLSAWATEPGILPFVPDEEDEAKAADNDEDVDGETTLRCNKRRRPRYKVSLNGQLYALPLFRAKICRETEVCVEHFDHFCPWVGNVVGVRNHRMFVLFTIFTSLVAVLVFAESLFFVANAAQDTTPPRQRAVALILVVYTSIILLAVGGLMIYHCDLVASNESTNERLKGVFRMRGNPYDKGATANCMSFWCTPTRRSYVCAENKDDDIPLPLLPSAITDSAV